MVTVPADSPLAAVWLWLKTGAADEDPEHAGVAHFLEHMLFKGTTRRGIGAASTEIESAGGDLNAYTTWDHTVLHASVRGAHTAMAIDVLADMARDPTFDAEELLREREVVLDEIRSYDEDVGVAINDTLRAWLWKGHAYGRPVLGVRSTVQTLDRDAVHRYWASNWTADRAVLVVAGPVTSADVLAEARKQLGTWKPGPGRSPIPSPSKPVFSRAHRIKRNFEAAEIQIGWRAPAIDHPDLQAMTLAAAVLGQGSASALSVELQLGEGLVGDAWASYSAAPGGGTFNIGFAPTEHETPEAIVAAMDIVDRLRRGGLAGSRISRSRDAMLAQSWFDHETVDGLAADAAWFTAHYGDPAIARVHERRLAALQPDDVYDVAKRWLDPERAVLVGADPDLEDKPLRKAWTRARAPRPLPQRDGTPRIATLPNGARIVVLPDQGKVAALRLVTLGGALTLKPRVAGLQAAWSDMVQAGCGPWDAVDYRRRTDDLAAAVGAGSGPSTWSLWASFPASELEDGVELVGEALLSPHFDAEEWARVHTELLDEVRTLPDRPGEVAMRELDKLIYKGHPWALPFSGTSATLGNIGPTTLRRWHRRHLDPSRLVVAVAGGIDPAWTTDVLGAWLADLTPTEPLPDRPEFKPLPRTRHVRRAGQNQATVIAAVRTGGSDDPHRHALNLASACLEGPSGRLFLELREKRGLGYDVWAEHRVGLDGGMFSVGLTCSEDRAREGADALVAELARLQNEGPTEAELGRCRELLDADLASALQRAAGRAGHLAFATLFGRPWRAESLAAERAQVTPDTVRAALSALRVDEPLVLSVLPQRPGSGRGR